MDRLQTQLEEAPHDGWTALLLDPPLVILIEEPENGVHPENLENLMDLFKRLSQGAFGSGPVQIILTTHSPYLLDYVQPEKVRVVTRTKDEGTKVTPMTDVPNLKKRLQ